MKIYRKYISLNIIRFTALFGFFLFILPACTASRVCFHDFPENCIKKLYSAVKMSPDTTKVKRVDGNCSAAETCLCYKIKYNGTMEDLKTWLIKELEDSVPAVFQINTANGKSLEVHFEPSAKNTEQKNTGTVKGSGPLSRGLDKGFD